MSASIRRSSSSASGSYPRAWIFIHSLFSVRTSSADVKGYSRLMGADEEGTLRTLTAYRKDVVAHSSSQLAGSLGVIPFLPRARSRSPRIPLSLFSFGQQRLPVDEGHGVFGRARFAIVAIEEPAKAPVLLLVGSKPSVDFFRS